MCFLKKLWSSILLIPMVRNVLFAFGADREVILYILLAREQWKSSLSIFLGIYRGKLSTDVDLFTRLDGRTCCATGEASFASQHRHSQQRMQG